MEQDGYSSCGIITTSVIVDWVHSVLRGSRLYLFRTVWTILHHLAMRGAALEELNIHQVLDRAARAEFNIRLLGNKSV